MIRRSALSITVAVLAGCASGATSPHTSAIPRALLREARPIGSGPRFHPPASGPVIGRCRRPVGPRDAVHVEVFAANRVVIVPAGIGTRPPRTITDARITAARCYGDLVTLDPTGVVLVRAGRRMTLAQVFRSWGEPLSGSRLASFVAATGARVAVFVDGRRWHGPATRVPLARHAEIVVEVGPYVPPHTTFAFAPEP